MKLNPKQDELLIAFKAGQLERVNALLDAGAAVDQEGDDGDTPLILASILGNLEVATKPQTGMGSARARRWAIPAPSGAHAQHSGHAHGRMGMGTDGHGQWMGMGNPWAWATNGHGHGRARPRRRARARMGAGSERAWAAMGTGKTIQIVSRFS